MNLPQFSVNKRVTVTMLTLIVVLAGVVSFFQLGLDLMPEMEYPVLSVITTYEGISPEDMEQLVTKPIEEAVNAVKGVKHVYSSSDEGISSVLAEFKWGTDLDAAAEDIRDMISQIQQFLPEDASDPIILKFDISQMPVLFYAFTGMSDTRDLRKFIDDMVKPEIERLDGVGAAMLFGGKVRQVNIEVDRAKLQAYNVSLGDIKMILRAENLNFSCGHITRGHQEYRIRVMGEYTDLDLIRNTPVAFRQGKNVYLKDVARVVDAAKEQRFRLRLNGKPSVMLAVTKQSGANTVEVVDRVKEKMEHLRRRMPAGMRFVAIMDQAHIIKKIIHLTTNNVLQGALLAVIFIFLFLRFNWRPTLAIGLAIPISVIASFIGLYVFDYTINLLTLGGLALAVGMLVDNSVVVIENTFRHIEQGTPRKEAAATGAGEVGMAITASTLTTICVFLPMILVGGLASEMSRPLASTVVISLVASLFVALTIVPAIASVLFKHRTTKDPASPGGAPTFFERMKSMYKKTLALMLRHRWKTIATALVAFLFSLVLIKAVGFDFMPKTDIPMMIMNAKLPVGTALEETDRILSPVEKEALNLPERTAVGIMIGPSPYAQDQAARAMQMGARDVNEAMLMIRLVDLEERKRTSIEIAEYLRGTLPRLKGASFEFMDMTSMLTGAMGQMPLEVKLFGKDLHVLKSYADEVAALVRTVRGVRDVRVSMQERKPEIQIHVDRQKAYHYGLTVAQVGDALQTANLGRIATRYRIRGEEYDIMVRLRKADRRSIEDIKNLHIMSPAGVPVRLVQVARIGYATGPLSIAREDRMRKITVSGDTTGRPIGDIVADIEKKMEHMHVPPGVLVAYGGSYRQMKDTFTALAWGFVAAIILVYMVMASQFESFTHPLVIMFTVPLSIIGAAGGLAVFHMAFSTAAFLGVIILAGVVVNNGIVMIDYVNQLRKKGMEKHEALIEGAATRLRPVLITALSTVIGVLPMALSRSQGWEMRAPLAVVLAGGLLVATFLTLFVVPAAYSVADRISYTASKRIMKTLHGEEKK